MCYEEIGPCFMILLTILDSIVNVILRGGGNMVVLWLFDCVFVNLGICFQIYLQSNLALSSIFVDLANI